MTTKPVTVAKVATNPLTYQQKQVLRPMANIVISLITILYALLVVLQIPALAPFPGTNHDPIMKALSFLAVFAFFATAFKAVEVFFLGTSIEKILNKHRENKLSGVFSQEVRWSAILGGFLQATYNMAYLLLVPVFAPAALASARSCVILALGVLELIVGILPRNAYTYVRLAFSVMLTFVGTGLMAFANGVSLFKAGGRMELFYLWVFFVFVGPGNVLLAIAEWFEYKGVHTKSISAGVYTLARFITYSAACFLGVSTWGMFNHDFPVFWAVVQMCLNRWYFIIPVALISGLADLFRICVKPIVSSTYMYVLSSLGIILTAVVQTVGASMVPQLFPQVIGGASFVWTCLLAGVVIFLGTALFPHQSRDCPTESGDLCFTSTKRRPGRL